MPIPTVREVLVAARDKIAKPNGWIQDHYAADANGRVCPETAPEAACFCADGALYAASNVWNLINDDYFNTMEVVRDAADALYIAIYGTTPTDSRHGGIIQWNDAKGRTQEEVVAVFDKAIAAQEGN